MLCAAALIGFQAYGQNLVVNPGFETGDFTGWTVNAGATGVVGPGFDGWNPHSGDFFAALGPVGGDGTMSQSFAASGFYDISFWMGSDGATPNDFTASFGGAVLYTATDIPNTQPNYTFFEFDNVAAGDGVLLFSFRNDPAYLALDDVSVTVSSGVPDSGSTMAMMSAGLLGLGGIARKLRR